MDGIFRRLEDTVAALWCLILALLFWPLALGIPLGAKIAIEIPWLIILAVIGIAIRNARRNKRASEEAQQVYNSGS